MQINVKSQNVSIVFFVLLSLLIGRPFTGNSFAQSPRTIEQECFENMTSAIPAQLQTAENLEGRLLLLVEIGQFMLKNPRFGRKQATFIFDGAMQAARDILNESQTDKTTRNKYFTGLLEQDFIKNIHDEDLRKKYYLELNSLAENLDSFAHLTQNTLPFLVDLHLPYFDTLKYYNQEVTRASSESMTPGDAVEAARNFAHSYYYARAREGDYNGDKDFSHLQQYINEAGHSLGGLLPFFSRIADTLIATTSSSKELGHLTTVYGNDETTDGHNSSVDSIVAGLRLFGDEGRASQLQVWMRQRRQYERAEYLRTKEKPTAEDLKRNTEELVIMAQIHTLVDDNPSGEDFDQALKLLTKLEGTPDHYEPKLTEIIRALIAAKRFEMASNSIFRLQNERGDSSSRASLFLELGQKALEAKQQAIAVSSWETGQRFLLKAADEFRGSLYESFNAATWNRFFSLAIALGFQNQIPSLLSSTIKQINRTFSIDGFAPDQPNWELRSLVKADGPPGGAFNELSQTLLKLKPDGKAVVSAKHQLEWYSTINNSVVSAAGKAAVCSHVIEKSESARTQAPE